MKKSCSYCEKEFNAKRSDALFCSHACKQMAYVNRKILKEHEARSRNIINSIKKELKKIPITQVESGSVFNALERVKRTEFFWTFCHSMLWSTQDFSEDQQNKFKRLIADHFMKGENVDATFKDLVEKVVLAKRYVLEKPYRFIADPQDWLNIKFYNGLSGATKWHDALQEQREITPQFGESLKIFSEAILNYAKERNILDIIFYRHIFVSLQSLDLLQWYMNAVMHYQFINH